MKFSLSKKIILSTCAIIIIFGILATFSVFYYVEKTVLDIEKSHLELLVKNASREIYREFSDIKQVAELIASQKELADFISNINSNYDINNLLAEYNIKEKYLTVYVMSREGKTLASTDPRFIDQDYSFRDYFNKALTGISTVEVAIGVTSHEIGYYISAPVRDQNGVIVGVVVIKVNPENINQLAVPSALTSEGHVMLVDNYGVILYSDIPERVYKSLGGLDDFEREEIKKQKKFSDINIQGLDYEPVYNMIKQDKKNGLLSFYDAADGSDEILAFSRLGNLPFYLVYEEDTDAFSRPAFDVSILVSLFVALAATMAALIIVILTRNFLRPFNNIIEAIKSISQGKYNNRIIINSKDELSEIANVFNEMVDKIKIHEDEIDNKIVRRTKELEKFNRLMVGREARMIDLKREINDLKNNSLKAKPLSIMERLEMGIGLEEKVIRELDAFYAYKVNNSDLSKESKRKIIKNISILVSDSKHHYQIINEIIEEYERKQRGSN